MASADSSFLSLLQEDIKCNFCLDQLKTPRALTCLHSFCERCLQKYEDQNRSPGRIACPVCQEETILEDSGIAGLRRDFRAIALIERLEREKRKQQEREEVPKTCEVCGSIDSEGKSSFVSCLQCKQVMCKQCGILHHKMKSSRNHTLNAVSFSGSPGPMVGREDTLEEYGLCVKHEEKKMDLFCSTCLTPVCKECSLDEHRPEDNHKCVTVEEYAPVMREEILSRLSTVPGLRADDIRVIYMIENVEGYVKNLDDKIKDAFSSCINRWKANLNDTKGKFFHLPMQKLGEVRQRAEDHLTNLEKTQTKAEEVCMHTKHFSLVSTFKELRDSLDTLSHEIPDVSSVETISKTIYQLQFRENEEKNVWSLVNTCRERRNILFNSVEASWPSAVTFTRDGRLAVSAQFEGPTDKDHEGGWCKGKYYAIKVTNASYRVAVRFSMEQRFVGPCQAVSSLSDLRFAVLHVDETYWDGECKLSLLNEESGCILTTRGRAIITDIVVDYEDNIFYSRRHPNQICIIRPNGTRTKVVSTGDLTPSQVAVCPCSPDQIVIKHDSSKVSVIDLNGKLLRTITRPEWKEVAIKCDNRKVLYVLWKSVGGLRTLQRFTMEGLFLDTLFESENHRCPTLLLTVSPDGSAAVVTDGGSNGNVTVISTSRKCDSYDA